MVQAPIWKDIYFDPATIYADVFNYKVYSQVYNSFIFYGKAYSKGGVGINISRICQNFMNNTIKDFNDGIAKSTGYLGTFYLQDVDGNNTYETYTFYDNWSYESNFSDVLSNHRITGHFAQGQKVFNNWSHQTDISTQGPSNYCGKYALLYKDIYGGFESFLIEGKAVKKDNFNTYSTMRTFDNKTSEFGLTRYVNDITTDYELHTGWLNDTQSDNLAKNLLSSPLVWLQDIEQNKIIPVVITNTEAEYKKFKDNRELVSYQIDIKESQNKIRM